MSNACCDKCGATLPTEGLETELSPVRRRIYQALLRAGKAGLDLPQLVDLVYHDDADGGPENASSTLTQIIKKMRGILAGHGVAVVVRPSHGPGARRYLEPLPTSEGT